MSKSLDFMFCVNSVYASVDRWTVFFREIVERLPDKGSRIGPSFHSFCFVGLLWVKRKNSPCGWSQNPLSKGLLPRCQSRFGWILGLKKTDDGKCESFVNFEEWWRFFQAVSKEWKLNILAVFFFTFPTIYLVQNCKHNFLPMCHFSHLLVNLVKPIFFWKS